MTPGEPSVHHFSDVTPEAARELLSLAHVSFEFGSRNTLYRTEALQSALQNITGQPMPEATDGPDLIEVLFLQAARTQGYQLCILQKPGSADAGWVCLIPDRDLDHLTAVVRKHHLRRDTFS